MSDGMHDKVFHSYPVRFGVEVRVVTSLFKAKWSVSIREWYLDADGKWCPGNKGFSIGAKHLGETVRALNDAVTALRAAGVPIDGEDVQ